MRGDCEEHGDGEEHRDSEECSAELKGFDRQHAVLRSTSTPPPLSKLTYPHHPNQ